MKNPRMQAWLTRPNGLADKLRASRGGLSVRQLADTLGWQSSKVSRIETGQQVPTEAEVNAWASATGVKDEDRQRMLDELEEAMSMRSTFRRRLKTSQAEVQAGFNNLESVSTFIRTMQPSVVPALLQMPAYARELFLQVEKVYRAGKDVPQAVAARMERQRHLDDQSKRFEFIIGEGALQYVPGRSEVMRAQLDRLISASDLPNVRLGITPMLRPLHWLPGPSGFILYDGEDAIIEGFLEDREYTGPAVGQLHDIMDVMWEDAAEGDEARALILAAVARLPSA